MHEGRCPNIYPEDTRPAPGNLPPNRCATIKLYNQRETYWHMRPACCGHGGSSRAAPRTIGARFLPLLLPDLTKKTFMERLVANGKPPATRR